MREKLEVETSDPLPSSKSDLPGGRWFRIIRSTRRASKSKSRQVGDAAIRVLRPPKEGATVGRSGGPHRQ